MRRRQVLKSEKAPTTDHYMIVRAAGPPGRRIVLFDYAQTRNVETLKRILTGPEGPYRGKLVCDGLELYDYVGEDAAFAGMALFGCLTHCRRYYDKSAKVTESPSVQQLARVAKPNPAHRAIAAMANHVPQLTLITQNVDDLHERAGSRDVLHLHGELSRPYCENCRQPYTHPPEIPQLPPAGVPLRQDVATDEVRKAIQSHASGSPWPGECTSTNSPVGRRILPPRCPSCGAKIRPGVVWFGERLPEDAWDSARDAAKHCDVLLVCGTSSVVQPAASLTDMAADAGATTIQVNPNPTDADSSVTFTLRGPAGIVLPQMVADTWIAHR
jgi:NAD-dependent deacetylase